MSIAILSALFKNVSALMNCKRVVLLFSDNSWLSSLECGINTNQDVSYMVVFFQTPTSDNYNVSVEVLLNGNLVGNGVFSGFCSAQQLNQVYVSMFSPINITAGDIVRIIYNP